MQWETQRGSVPLLGLWSPAGTVPEKLRSQVIPGDGRRIGPWWTLTQVVSRLGRELGCMKSQGLVKNSRQQTRGICLKKKKKALSLCLRNSHAAMPGQRRGRRRGHDLLQIRAPHRLIKVGQQGFEGLAVPRETSWGEFELAQHPDQRRGRRDENCSHSVHLTD